MAPGALLLLATSVAFHFAATPVAVIALMAGIGAGTSLVSTPASIHAAVISPPAEPPTYTPVIAASPASGSNP